MSKQNHRLLNFLSASISKYFKTALWWKCIASVKQLGSGWDTDLLKLASSGFKMLACGTWVAIGIMKFDSVDETLIISANQREGTEFHCLLPMLQFTEKSKSIPIVKLPTAYWQMLTDNCLLPTAYCLLPTSYWRLFNAQLLPSTKLTLGSKQHSMSSKQ